MAQRVRDQRGLQVRPYLPPSTTTDSRRSCRAGPAILFGITERPSDLLPSAATSSLQATHGPPLCPKLSSRDSSSDTSLGWSQNTGILAGALGKRLGPEHLPFSGRGDRASAPRLADRAGLPGGLLPGGLPDGTGTGPPSGEQAMNPQVGGIVRGSGTPGLAHPALQASANPCTTSGSRRRTAPQWLHARLPVPRGQPAGSRGEPSGWRKRLAAEVGSQPSPGPTTAPASGAVHLQPTSPILEPGSALLGPGQGHRPAGEAAVTSVLSPELLFRWKSPGTSRPSPSVDFWANRAGAAGALLSGDRQHPGHPLPAPELTPAAASNRPDSKAFALGCQEQGPPPCP